MDAFLAILLLKQPLAESFWVFSNPVKSLSGLFLQIQNSKSSLLFCAYLHTFSTPSWRSIFSSTERSTVLFFCAPMHLLNALLAELSESSVILVFFQLSAEFFFQLHLVHTLNAHLAELYRILSDSVCNCVSATQPCLLRCSATSQVFFLSC
jgi:hypothetical protein